MRESSSLPPGQALPLRVLLVEDNEAHAHLIRRCLQDNPQPITVTHVLDGQLALEALMGVERAALPDLVLLDLRLPRVGGLTVLDRIKSQAALKMIPVVVLTSSASQKDRETAYAHHANSYLVKPADFSEFRAQLNSVLDYWGGWNRRWRDRGG